MEEIAYDGLLLVSYGGPDGADDVIPFIENVLQGRKHSAQRLEELAEPYMYFGGTSPINEQNKALLAAIIDELRGTTRSGCDSKVKRKALSLPVYWANLHWHPFLLDVLRQMSEDGISRALAFATSAFGSYPGCRKYREAIEAARAEVGPEAPRVDKMRLFYNHPGFIEAVSDRIQDALQRLNNTQHQPVQILFTAHSLPLS
ncbi:MAG: ferrochelatase, partial [Pirellulales bacterium]|nr:ferrochelatase [Pirellulales bacterium]